MFEYLFYLFLKTVLLMIGMTSIRIGSIFWNDDGAVDPLMVLLFFVGTLVLTIWNEIDKKG